MPLEVWTARELSLAIETGRYTIFPGLQPLFLTCLGVSLKMPVLDLGLADLAGFGLVLHLYIYQLSFISRGFGVTRTHC